MRPPPALGVIPLASCSAVYGPTMSLRTLAVRCALVGGVALSLFGLPVILSGHEVDCDGEAMQPGDVCGVNALVTGTGRSYEEVARETDQRRAAGYGGIVLLVGTGAATAVARVRRPRRS